MRTSLEGIYIPAVTPFDQEEKLSEEMLRYNIAKWNQTGISGYMCLGSNGEFRMLDNDESFRVIRTFAECRGEDKGLIVGAGRESLYQTLKFINRIRQEEWKIDYISILTPHYFKNSMSDRALVEYYTKIADFSDYPILLYCAPGFANSVCISCEALEELAKHPNIHGIKDTSKDMMDDYIDTVGIRTDFCVMAGSVNTLYKCLKRGGKGAVVSAANYFPEECAKLITLWKEAGEEAFLLYYDKLRELIRQTGARGGVAGVKCCMNLCGYQAGVPRRPVLPLDAEQERAMRQALEGRIDI